jgi:hypothetical protein
VVSGTRPTPEGPRALVRVVVQQPAEPGDTDAGDTYYLRHTPGWGEGEPFTPDSEGFATVAEAMAAADELLPGPIEWDDEDRLVTYWDD